METVLENSVLLASMAMLEHRVKQEMVNEWSRAGYESKQSRVIARQSPVPGSMPRRILNGNGLAAAAPQPNPAQANQVRKISCYHLLFFYVVPSCNLQKTYSIHKSQVINVFFLYTFSGGANSKLSPVFN